MARSDQNEITIRKCGGESRRADLFDANSLTRAAEGADVVIHAASAIPTSAKPRPEDWKTNDRIRRDGTRELALAAAKVRAKQFLVQSITWVARPADQSAFDETSPLNPDPSIQSTADMETMARADAAIYGFRVAIIRCGWFHSADSGHTRLFGQQLAAGKLPIVGKGDAVWSFVHVDDAASAFVAAAEAGRSGLWHVTDDRPVVSGEYLRGFAERIGTAAPRRVPAWLARIVAGKMAVNFMTASTRTSNARFRRDFNWKPRFLSYREALDQIAGEWRRENFLDLGSRIAA
jgi:nucleoside-diphosphate-sugar epimerase